MAELRPRRRRLEGTEPRARSAATRPQGAAGVQNPSRGVTREAPRSNQRRTPRRTRRGAACSPEQAAGPKRPKGAREGALFLCAARRARSARPERDRRERGGVLCACFLCLFSALLLNGDDEGERARNEQRSREFLARAPRSLNVSVSLARATPRSGYKRARETRTKKERACRPYRSPRGPIGPRGSYGRPYRRTHLLSARPMIIMRIRSRIVMSI